MAGETTEVSLAGFGIPPSTMPSPPSNAPTKPSLRTERLKNVLMIGAGLVLISLAGFLGYRKYLSSRTIES